jgi:hypothetical protein
VPRSRLKRGWTASTCWPPPIPTSAPRTSRWATRTCLKSQLLLRPVYHRLEHRIRAHVLLCWLALLLTRIAERACGQSWRRINRETGRLQQVTLTGEAGTIVQTTPLRPTHKAIYQALSIDPPPRVSAFDPA